MPRAARRADAPPRVTAAHPVSEGVGDLGDPSRGIGPQILAQLAEALRVVAAGREQDDRVEQAREVPGIRRAARGAPWAETTRSIAANSSAARTGFER